VKILQEGGVCPGAFSRKVDMFLPLVSLLCAKEVTAPRMDVFREAILELFEQERKR